VYLRPLDSDVSGLFAFSDSVGACMLLNSKHPEERIRQTAGHEIGHFLTSRYNPEALLVDEHAASREERYADCFARSLLTPDIAVRRAFADITSGQSHFTRRHVILLAASFGVSREAMVRRLEELSVVRKGLWDWFSENGGISNEQALEVLGRPVGIHYPLSKIGGLVPHRLALLAREASKRSLYSEGQLAQMLHLDRLGVREVLDGIDQEVSEANEQFEILR